MQTKIKNSIDANRFLGEFIGTLKGVSLWDIPEELKIKLQNKIEELENIDIVAYNLPGMSKETELLNMLNQMEDKGRLTTEEQNILRKINVDIAERNFK